MDEKKQQSEIDYASAQQRLTKLVAGIGLSGLFGRVHVDITGRVPTAVWKYNTKTQDYDIYIGYQLMQKLDDEEVLFVIEHELLHHVSYRRTDNRSKLMNNVVLDIAVNKTLYLYNPVVAERASGKIYDLNKIMYTAVVLACPLLDAKQIEQLACPPMSPKIKLLPPTERSAQQALVEKWGQKLRDLYIEIWGSRKTVDDFNQDVPSPLNLFYKLVDFVDDAQIDTESPFGEDSEPENTEQDQQPQDAQATEKPGQQKTRKRCVSEEDKAEDKADSNKNDSTNSDKNNSENTDNANNGDNKDGAEDVGDVEGNENTPEDESDCDKDGSEAGADENESGGDSDKDDSEENESENEDDSDKDDSEAETNADDEENESEGSGDKDDSEAETNADDEENESENKDDSDKDSSESCADGSENSSDGEDGAGSNQDASDNNVPPSQYSDLERDIIDYADNIEKQAKKAGKQNGSAVQFVRAEKPSIDTRAIADIMAKRTFEQTIDEIGAMVDGAVHAGVARQPFVLRPTRTTLTHMACGVTDYLPIYANKKRGEGVPKIGCYIDISVSMRRHMQLVHAIVNRLAEFLPSSTFVFHDELMPMPTAAWREIMPLGGGTNFDAVLLHACMGLVQKKEWFEDWTRYLARQYRHDSCAHNAYNMLQKYGISGDIVSEDCPVILMITDGEDDISATARERFKSSGKQLLVLQLTDEKDPKHAFQGLTSSLYQINAQSKIIYKE